MRIARRRRRARAFYNEIEPYAADWLENLIGAGLIARGRVERRSIAELRPTDLHGFKQAHARLERWLRINERELA
jgi:DNA (cytosine-5)-methyltransferase 1